MSATNSTPIINLPLFIGTDKPAWLTDWNGAMNAIDAAIAALQTAESGTATSLASLAQSLEALSGTVGQHTTALQTLTSAVSGNTGSINTINSLIGNGLPTTTDKTIIGAINEIYGEIGGGDGIDADEVNYDNTSSGLTATDVQAAIDEVNAKIPQGGSVEADDVAYDNTQSGLVATDVQAAIDELAAGEAYSTTEHKTGKKFVDGKDIYERTYYANNVNITTTSAIDTSWKSTDIDTLVDFEGSVYGTFGSLTAWFGLNTPGSTSVATDFSSVGMRLEINGTATVNKYVLTFRYTKP